MRIRLRQDRLARRIADSRMSQNRWALRIGISTGHLSELVNGKRPYPSALTRRKLLAAFEAELEELFRIETAPNPVQPPAPPSQQPEAAPAASLVDWKNPRLGLRVRLERLPAQHGEPRSRGDGVLRTFDQDLRHGLRILLKNPGYALLATAALALGIGGNSLIFSLVYGVLLRPLDFKNPQQLVIAYESQVGDPEGTVSYDNAVDWLEQGGVLQSMGLWRPANYAWENQGVAVRIGGSRVSAGFFSTLGADFEIGRGFEPEDDQEGAADVVVLGRAFWERLGSEPDLGSIELRLDGRPHQVIGVLPQDFSFPVQISEVQVWTSLARDTDLMSSRGNHAYGVIARLKEGVGHKQAQSSLESLAARIDELHPAEQQGRSMRLAPLHEKAVRDSRSALVLFSGAVGLVLLIACANVGNLMLARGSARRKEMALRAALGAGRPRLVRQLLSESFVLAGLGGLAGIVLAFAGLRPFLSWLPAEIPRLGQVGIDAWVLAFTVAVTLATALLCGVAPALQATRFDLNEPLSQSARSSGGSGGRMHRWLVASEVAFALALLIVAGLFLRSFTNLLGVDPGFRSENVLAFQVAKPFSDDFVGPRQTKIYESILQGLGSIPGVAEAGLASSLPLQSRSVEVAFAIKGRPRQSLEVQEPLRYVSISPGFLSSIGIPLLRGRLLSHDDRLERPGAALINQAFAQRYWPDGQDPLGEKLLISLRLEQQGEPVEWEVVGIVGDARQLSLDEAPRPEVYVSFRQQTLPWSYFTVRAASGGTGLVSAVRSAVSEADPTLPIFDVSTLESEVLGSVAQERFAASALGSFAGLALLLAAVGVYGVLSYAVSLRTREVGIRMAMGAKSGDILKLMVRSGLGPVAIGLLAGGLSAVALSELLSAQLFQLSPLDPATYATVAAILLLASLAACYFPARRASRVDPLVALRTE